MRRAFIILSVGLVAACGGGGPTAPSPQPFSQTIQGTVAVFGTTMHPLSVPRSGNMRLELSWPGGVDLDLFLSPPTCASLYPKSGCGLLAGSDGLANPEVITRTVQAGEPFRIWVDNLSLTQSVNYTLRVTIQ